MAKKRKAKKKAVVLNHNQNENENENVGALIWRVTDAAQSFLTQNDLVLLPSQSLRLESLISSIISQSPKPSPLPPLSDSWFRRFRSVSNSSQWLHAFRMSKPSFSHLLQLLSPSLAPSFPHIAPDCVLAAALFRLAHASPYPAISRRFSISPPDASRAFFALCKALSDYLGHLFELRTGSERVVVGFGWRSLPNCFGVLGLTKFIIDDSFLGENGGLMVQALVDSEGRFLDVSAGWPSTIKPETILRQTKLYREVEESKELLNGPSYNLSEGCLIPQYIMGDSCFPLLPWLLTPYNTVNDDSFGSAQRAFNSAHGNAMCLVRDAFRSLRSRWRLLSPSRKWKRDCVEYLPFVVVAACLLHNFVVKFNEPMPEVEDDFLHNQEESLPSFDGVGDDTAVRVRDALALHLRK